MVILARLIMLAVIAYGLLLIFRKDTRTRLLSFVRTVKGVNIVGSGRIVIGAIFLSVSSTSRVPWLITLFGVLSIIAGIIALVAKKEVISRMAGWWEEKPESLQKLMGVIPVIIGIIILLAL
jgi:hypothetical protein